MAVRVAMLLVNIRHHHLLVLGVAPFDKRSALPEVLRQNRTTNGAVK